MSNTIQRSSWFSSIAAIAILGLTTLLSGCGGGGATSSATLPLAVVPDAAVAYAYSDTPTSLMIRGGTKPFNVYSSNTAVISFNPVTMPGGNVPDETIILGSPTGNYGRVNNVNDDTEVTLTIRDADGTQVKVIVTVKPSSLNDSLTITDPLNAGTQGNASVRATTVTGGPVVGHPIRFHVVDQGAAYGFICNPTLGGCSVIETDAAGRVITVETTTDANGDAFAVTRADVGAATQYATISATDMVTGHVLRKQFVIAGLALAALPSSVTWTITDSDTTAGVSYSCVGAATSFYVYGGTPPYTITSTAPSIVTVGGAATTTVNASGGTFVAQAACGAEGDANLVITDAAGAILTNITFKVVFKPVSL